MNVFLRVTANLEIGSLIDGWQVVWYQPGRRRLVWHVMVMQRRVEF